MNSRLQKLRKLLIEKNLDAVFVSSLSSIIYLTNFSDFTTVDRDGFLLITKKNQYIFTHGIYKEAVEKNVKSFDLIPIQRENPISKAIKNIVNKERIKRLGFEDFDLKVNEYEKLVKEIDKNILIPMDILRELRIKKTPDEINAIKKACELGDKAYSYILKKIRTDITEKELTFLLESFIKKNGAEISFASVVAFGPNASKPHHVPGNTKLKKNNFVLLDFGVKLDTYCSDMTRTVFFGKATKEQKKAYQTVLESQELAIDFIKNNIKMKKQIIGKKVDQTSREYVIQKGFPSMPHSLGHGVGIEVHEPPRLTVLSEEKIENGMVFSVEPGIYLPEKFGIRIEDIFTIEKNKLIQLTESSKEFIEL